MTPLLARRILGVTTSAAILLAALLPDVTRWQGVAVCALVAAVIICERHDWTWTDREAERRWEAEDRDREARAFGDDR